MKLSDVTLCENDNTLDIIISQTVFRPTDITPLCAYHALRDLFGPPNCHDFDDTKSQWAYYLQVPDARLEIHDWKLDSWSIAVHTDASEAVSKQLTSLHHSGAPGTEHDKLIAELRTQENEARAEGIAKAFCDAIRKHAIKFSGKVDRAAEDATRFVLQNPFALYYSSAHALLDKARDNDNKPGFAHLAPFFVNGSQDYCRAAFFLFVAAFEGLVNFIYELYAKADLRDERIYERLAREQIDIRVRLAPLYCNCFSSVPIDLHFLRKRP